MKSGQDHGNEQSTSGSAPLEGDSPGMHRTEERFRRLLEHVESGFVAGEFVRMPTGEVVDIRYIEVNAVWERTTGISRDRVLGRTLWEVAPDWADEWLIFLNELAVTGRPVTFCRHVVGSGRWFEVQAVQPFPNEFSLLFTDISELREAYRRLQESEIEYKYADELNPSVSWSATPDGRLIRVSQRWTEWTGLSGHGNPWATAVHPDDLQPNIDLWARCVEENRP